MRKYLVTYCNEKYEINRKKLINIASQAFDGVFSYTPSDINNNFFVKNSKILTQERGIGYWLWKPYILLETLKVINDGDVIFYLDSGDTFLAEIVNYIEDNLKKCNIVLVPGSHKQKLYTKRDCFVYMNCDEEKYWETIQVEAGIILIKKNKEAVDFVSEWLKYCEDERILTDISNISGKDNFSGFIDHRHDQSVLTNLAKKYNIKLDNSVRNYVTCNVSI